MRRYFIITEVGGGVRTNFFLFWRGGTAKFLLDNSSFSPPLLIIIAQSLKLDEYNAILLLLNNCYNFLYSDIES